MSWVNRIDDNITIITGDGKTYTPLYMLTSKTIEYNIAEFEFPNIEGTLVDRRTPKGARHKFELVFQGEGHLDLSEEFQDSNRDPRPWTVAHPYFGELIVQPVSLTFNVSGLNTTKITGEVVETITRDRPSVTTDPATKAQFETDNQKEADAEVFSSAIDPEQAEINQLTSDINTLNSSVQNSISVGEELTEYMQMFNLAATNIINAVNDKVAAAESVVNLITFPATFTSTVEDRLLLLVNQFADLSKNLLTYLTPSSKVIYEMNGASLVNACIITVLNPIEGDYLNMNNVFYAMDQVKTIYDQYLTNLDTISVGTGAGEDDYIPEHDHLSDLAALVDLVLSELMDIALDSRQERAVYLSRPSNAIVLAHRFYGPSLDDSNLDRFIRENSIGMTEFLQIPKDKKVVYYVS